MSKIFLTSLLVFISICLFAQEIDFLVNNQNFPYEYFEEDKSPAGLILDIIAEIENKSSLKINVKADLYPLKIESITDSKNVSVLITSNNVSKNKNISASKAIMNLTYDVVSKQKNSIKDISELTHKSVLILEQDIDKFHFLIERDIRLITVNSVKEAITYLQSDYYNYLFLDRFKTIRELKRNNTDLIINDIEVLKTPLKFVSQVENKEVISKINLALERMYIDGSYQKIISRWFYTPSDFNYLKQTNRLMIIIWSIIFIAFMIMLISLISFRKKLASKIKTIQNLSHHCSEIRENVKESYLALDSAILITDSKGIIDEVNDNLLELFQIKKENIISRDIKNIVKNTKTFNPKNTLCKDDFQRILSLNNEIVSLQFNDKIVASAKIKILKLKNLKTSGDDVLFIFIPEQVDDFDSDCSKTIIDQFSQGIVTCNYEGAIDNCNASFVKLVNIEKKYVINENLWNYCSDSSNASVLQNRFFFFFSQNIKRTSVDISFNVNSQEKLLHTEWIKIENKDERKVLIIITDFSKLKESEDALIESKTLYNTVYDKSPVGILNFDKSGNIVKLNDFGFEFFEILKNELTQFDNFIPGKWKNDISIMLKGEIIHNKTMEITFGENSKFVSYNIFTTQNSNADINGGILVFEDVSDIKSLQKELYKEKQYYSKLGDSLTSALFSITCDGKIVRWNTNAQKWIEGKKAIFDNVFSKYERIIQEYNSFKDSTKEFLQTKISEENTRLYNLNFIRIIFDEEALILLQIEDISNYEKIETQLRQIQKMESIGKLSGGLAHDFNNVLSGITGTLSLMERQLEKEQSSTKIKSYLEIIKMASDRATKMVSQLLTISRKQDTNMTNVSIIEALENTVYICNNTFDKRIKINISCEFEKVEIIADKTQIEQVLLNLCINASHAMTIMKKNQEFGGQLNLSIESFTADSYFESIYQRSGYKNYWLIKIQDNGVGIPDEVKDKIFDPFFTTKEKDFGTGLGLSMVYTIVTKHDGVIDFYSQQGVGTTFLVYIPKYENRKEIVVNVDNEEVIKGAGTILVVDDEEIIRITTESMLTECGYNVIAAESGLEAINKIHEFQGRIDLIILDVSMPKMSGKETYRMIKQANPDIPVIMASGFQKNDTVIDVVNLGAVDFIQKPFTLAKLSQKVAEFILD